MFLTMRSGNGADNMDYLTNQKIIKCARSSVGRAADSYRVVHCEELYLVSFKEDS